MQSLKKEIVHRQPATVAQLVQQSKQASTVQMSAAQPIILPMAGTIAQPLVQVLPKPMGIPQPMGLASPIGMSQPIGINQPIGLAPQMGMGPPIGVSQPMYVAQAMPQPTLQLAATMPPVLPVHHMIQPLQHVRPMANPAFYKQPIQVWGRLFTTMYKQFSSIVHGFPI